MEKSVLKKNQLLMTILFDKNDSGDRKINSVIWPFTFANNA